MEGPDLEPIAVVSLGLPAHEDLIVEPRAVRAAEVAKEHPAVAGSRTAWNRLTLWL